HTRCSRDWSSDVCSSDLDWPDLDRVVEGHPDAVTFGTSPAADFRVEDLHVEGGGSRFTLRRPAGAPLRVSLAVPGRHNALNAARSEERRVGSGGATRGLA